jgi:hypothetical protein
MTPGPVEEGAKVASNVVEGLKSQPVSLALIVMNALFILFMGWLAHEWNLRTTHQYEVKDQLIARLIDKCGNSQQSQQP